MGQSIVVMLLFGAGMKFLAPALMRDENAMYSMMLVYAGLLVLVAVRAARAGMSWRSLFGRAPSIRDVPILSIIVPLALITGGALTVVFVPLSYVAPEAIEELVLRDTSAFDVHSVWQLIRLIFAVSFVAPLVEELVFRGLFLTRIARKYGTPAGVLFSSALFALMHVEWLGHFVIGVAFALVYLRTRSLFLAMLTHGLYNLVTVVPIAYAFLTHQPPDGATTLAEFRDGLSVGVLALIAGFGLLWFYLDLYWPDHQAARVLEQPTPYDASFSEAVPSE